jgi:Tol biopolymer transport system component
MRYYFLLIFLLPTVVAVTAQEQSCDSSQLVYIATNGKNYPDIFVSNSDGADEETLTSDNLSEANPRWSPDGTRIVFTVSAKPDNYLEENTLTIINADGGNRQILYSQGNISNPHWSPNGEYIAFFSTAVGQRGVYIINADGTNVRNFNVAWLVEYFAWSPDSQYLAVQAQSESRHQDIYLVTITDGEVQNLTQGNFGAAIAPAWTPDNRITFSAITSDNSEIRILDPFVEDLTSQTFLPISTGAELLWSPVELADEAVFVNQGDIWLYSAGELTNLTQDAEWVWWRDWSSDGRFLAYTYIQFEPEFSEGINILDVDTGEKRRFLEGGDMADWRPC